MLPITPLKKTINNSNSNSNGWVVRLQGLLAAFMAFLDRESLQVDCKNTPKASELIILLSAQFGVSTFTLVLKSTDMHNHMVSRTNSVKSF